MQDEKLYDAFDDATNAELPAQEYYGEMSIDAWACALVKGQGKVPYDATQHGQKFTAVDLILTPLSDMGLQWNIERNLIAQSKAWAKITWASAQECGLQNARELAGKWVRAKLTPTGRKWENASGETKEETTIEFIAIFDDEAACRAAYLASKGDATSTEQTQAQPAPAANDPRKTALQFAEAIVKNSVREAGNDPVKVKELVKRHFDEMPLVGQVVSVDDAEVVEMMAKAMYDATANA